MKLSPREKETLLWAAKGKSATDTAAILGLSQHTITFHRRQIMLKMGVASVTTAVAIAIQLGIIRLSDEDLSNYRFLVTLV